MPLTIVVKLNGKTIAGADIANVSNLADVSDYLVSGYEQASPVTGLPYRGATTRVVGHERRQSVWALVEKTAAELKKDPTP